MKIIVDTREQLPLWAPSSTITRRKLLVGDYSTVKLEASFCIERKSGIDLYGSILKGHVRFKKEIIRAKLNNIELVIFVECTKKDFELKNFPSGAGRLCPGDRLLKVVNGIQHNHNIEIVWCKDRDSLVTRLLSRLRVEESKL